MFTRLQYRLLSKLIFCICHITLSDLVLTYSEQSWMPSNWISQTPFLKKSTLYQSKMCFYLPEATEAVLNLVCDFHVCFYFSQFLPYFLNSFFPWKFMKITIDLTLGAQLCTLHTRFCRPCLSTNTKRSQKVSSWGKIYSSEIANGGKSSFVM